jgi:hypothetical protein
MEKWEDNKAWFLVLPVFIIVALDTPGGAAGLCLFPVPVPR